MTGTPDHITITRHLWATAVAGLRSDDPTIRRHACEQLLQAGLPDWIRDFEQPPAPSATSRADRIRRMNAAFHLTLDNVPIAGSREGDPDVVDLCSDLIAREWAAAQAEQHAPKAAAGTCTEDALHVPDPLPGALQLEWSQHGDEPMMPDAQTCPAHPVRFEIGWAVGSHYRIRRIERAPDGTHVSDTPPAPYELAREWWQLLLTGQVR